MPAPPETADVTLPAPQPQVPAPTPTRPPVTALLPRTGDPVEDLTAIRLLASAVVTIGGVALIRFARRRL
jgi:hypothetical protein